jgi:hypothetical protein
MQGFNFLATASSPLITQALAGSALEAHLLLSSIHAIAISSIYNALLPLLHGEPELAVACLLLIFSVVGECT